MSKQLIPDYDVSRHDVVAYINRSNSPIGRSMKISKGMQGHEWRSGRKRSNTIDVKDLRK